MRLIPAPGGREMQDALDHPYVRKIVDILLQVKGQGFFSLVARFIKDHDQLTSSTFTVKLQALRMYYQRRPNLEGNFVVPPYVDELVSTLEALYRQNQIIIGFQRGAILELLASKLVHPRCRSGECMNNHRFIDGRYASDQIDVAVLSESRQQIEGYSCKIKPIGLMSEDCTNLTTLVVKAQERDYDVHIGVVCFDNSILISQRINDRLKDFPFNEPIYAYGLDNIQELEINPFL